MKSLAAIAIVLGASGATTHVAFAQPAMAHAISSDLRDAAFSRSTSAAEAEATQDDVIGRLLDLANPTSPPFKWRDDYLAQTVAGNGDTVDTLRITYGQNPNLFGPYSRLTQDPANPDYEIRLTRDWPVAFSLRGERYGVDLTPHAGLGFSNRGNSAEAGATLTFGRNSQSLANALDHLGVHDGAALDQAGRWYVFAAASGRAMGLNMQKDEAKGWDRSWSMDNASALVGDAQLGLGWRQGIMQTSVGLIHREVKGDHAIWGQEFKTDSMVALSFSIKPKH